MKITPKQFAGFRRAYTASGFNGISANDGWNKQEFGITHVQYSALTRVVDALYGMAAKDEVRRLTLPTVKSFLAGEKVSLCRASDDMIARMEAAFPG